MLRHAAASTLCLQASAAGRELSIRVRDDGRGMQQPAPPSGFGLLGVRERALALGGSVDIVSSPGAGSEICLRLPGAIA